MDNQILQGDCAHILAGLPTESVDMVYLDPPFFTQREWTGTSGASFSDRWGSMEDYLGFIEVRVRDCRRVLKRSGSVYLHCDDHMSHHLRLMLDDLFGEENFVNEIIWRRPTAKSNAKRFGRVHDTILFYARNANSFVWNPQYTAYEPAYIDKEYRYSDDVGRYLRGPIYVPTPGSTGEPWKGVPPPKGNRYSPRRTFPGAEDLPEDPFEALDALDGMGRIHWPKKEGGKPYQKYYLTESKGRPVQDIIDDITISPTAKERVGYPTQKPVALLDRLIRATTNEGDLVLDPFCGSGTTCIAAARSGRRYLGMDRSPDAVEIARQRIADTLI